jgi:hypothetical protein
MMKCPCSEELCWFFIISCGPIGVVESVVGKMIFFSYWNTKEGYSKNKWDTMNFFWGFPFFSYLQINVVNVFNVEVWIFDIIF